jgi:hypothetical protein
MSQAQKRAQAGAHPNVDIKIRIARPTDKLDAVVTFYKDAVGLPIIGHFEGHAGYSGVMLGTPDARCHLEFTHADVGSPCPAPSKDNLLVPYLSSPERAIPAGSIDGAQHAFWCFS